MCEDRLCTWTGALPVSSKACMATELCNEFKADGDCRLCSSATEAFVVVFNRGMTFLTEKLPC